MIYFLTAIANALIGYYLIRKGINKMGKKEYFDDNGGIFYVFWVVVSTVGLIIYGTINL